MNRWFRVAGGVSLNLCLGAAYVYSVFLTPLQREFGWTRSELSVAFTLSIAFIAMGVLVGGRWQDRRGPAVVSLAGALLFSAGIFLSRYTDSLAWLYGCYGVVVGLGSGIGYTCPLSVGMKWFPERRGLVTGMMVMGYGAGGAVIAPLAGYLIQRFGWRDTFGILGAGFLAVTVAGSLFLRNPPDGWRPSGWSPPAAAKGAGRGGRDFLPREMVGTGAFRRMWVAYAFGTAAGLMVIGHLAAFALGAGFSARDSALSVGVLSVGNGCGRIASGWMSDHIGRVRTLTLVMGATALLLFLAPGVSTVPMLFAAVFLIGYCYGSQLAVFPFDDRRLFRDAKPREQLRPPADGMGGRRDHRPDGGGMDLRRHPRLRRGVPDRGSPCGRRRRGGRDGQGPRRRVEVSGLTGAGSHV